LWIVVPKLIEWPRLVAQAFERFDLLRWWAGAVPRGLGTFNVARTYPWQFFFPAAHYWVAWLTIGARRAPRGEVGGDPAARSLDGGRADVLGRGASSRRCRATAATVFVAVAGSTVGPLEVVRAGAAAPGRGPRGCR
jgi:hypothetical protein